MKSCYNPPQLIKVCPKLIELFFNPDGTARAFKIFRRDLHNSQDFSVEMLVQKGIRSISFKMSRKIPLGVDKAAFNQIFNECFDYLCKALRVDNNQHDVKLIRVHMRAMFYEYFDDIKNKHRLQQIAWDRVF